MREVLGETAFAIERACESFEQSVELLHERPNLFRHTWVLGTLALVALITASSGELPSLRRLRPRSR